MNGTDLTTLKFVVDIDLNSMFTDTEAVTKHLKSADFFDVQNNSKAKFTSSKVEKDGDNYKVTGKLNMHGKSKDVTFPAKLALKDGGLTMASSFKINRHDWDISYGKGFVIDDVSMDVSITAKEWSYKAFTRRVWISKPRVALRGGLPWLQRVMFSIPRRGCIAGKT